VDLRYLMEDQRFAEIMGSMNKKLGVLIALQLNQQNSLSLKEKIYLLQDLALNSSEISSILGISKVHASKEKSLRKKNGR